MYFHGEALTDLTQAWFDKHSHLQKARKALPEQVFTCEQKDWGVLQE